METRAKKKARGRNTFKSVSGEQEEEKRDRLSELPDDLIHEIFSFLDDIKQAVQTCVLSKRWKRTWASHPYLNFDQQCHHTGAKFKNFVRKVLSRRDDCNVIKFEIDSRCWALDESLSKRIINYAVSHNVQHLHLYLDNVSCHLSNRLLGQLDSIKTLKLSGFKIDFSFGFKTLTLLKLRNCSFCYETDPFAHCPNLKSLHLWACKIPSSLKIFKISGPQLDILELSDAFWLEKNQDFLNIDIVAPNIKSFTLRGSVCWSFISGLNFPVLDRVDLHLFEMACPVRYIISAVKLIATFEGLQNVQYMELSNTAIKLLNFASGLLKKYPPPFKRIMYLKVSGWRISSSIPYHVITYLLGNDPYEEITHVKGLYEKDVVFWKVQT